MKEKKQPGVKVLLPFFLSFFLSKKEATEEDGKGGTTLILSACVPPLTLPLSPMKQQSASVSAPPLRFHSALAFCLSQFLSEKAGKREKAG